MARPRKTDTNREPVAGEAEALEMLKSLGWQVLADAEIGECRVHGRFTYAHEGRYALCLVKP